MNARSFATYVIVGVSVAICLTQMSARAGNNYSFVSFVSFGPPGCTGSFGLEYDSDFGGNGTPSFNTESFYFSDCVTATSDVAGLYYAISTTLRATNNGSSSSTTILSCPCFAAGNIDDDDNGYIDGTYGLAGYAGYGTGNPSSFYDDETTPLYFETSTTTALNGVYTTGGGGGGDVYLF